MSRSLLGALIIELTITPKCPWEGISWLIFSRVRSTLHQMHMVTSTCVFIIHLGRDLRAEAGDGDGAALRAYLESLDRRTRAAVLRWSQGYVCLYSSLTTLYGAKLVMEMQRMVPTYSPQGQPATGYGYISPICLSRFGLRLQSLGVYSVLHQVRDYGEGPNPVRIRSTGY